MPTRPALAVLSASFLAAAAGSALAQPVIDGNAAGDNYGPILWAQNQPTSFGDNLAGPGGTVGNPADVTKGVEVVVPMSVLGNPSTIRLAGFINGGGHDYASNQVIGGLPTNTPNLAEPRTINFANITGNQFVNLAPSRVAAASLITDGNRDTAYGAPKFVQNNYTGFGNNTTTGGVTAGGSELDAIYAVISDNGTPANTADDLLYILVAGNLESNFNKLELFFDTGAPGQNTLRSDNTQGGVNRMGPGNNQPGLTFDTGFSPSYWVSVTNGGTPTSVYVDFSQLLPTGGGAGGYAGTTTPLSNGVLTGGDTGAPALQVSIDNGNIIGVNGSPTGISLPNIDVANGSEIDGVYGAVYNGKLYLTITGNLQTNYNKLDLFFDVNATDGQNRLRSDNVDIDYNGLNRMGAGGGGDATRLGLKFDTGFTADYFIGITNGNYPVENYVNAAVLRANGALYVSGFVVDYSATDGGLKSAHNPVNFPATYRDMQQFIDPNPLKTDGGPRKAQQGQLIPGLISASINNTNVGGVTATTATPPSTSGAASVTTGVELVIDLAELGWDGGPIKLAGFLNNQGHDFVSNQVIGGLPAVAELGESASVDFSAIAGNQFIIIPSTPPGPVCGTADFNGDGDVGTDQDIEAFFRCLAGTCCPTCFAGGADFNGDGDVGTDQDIEAFFRVLAGNPC